MRPPPDLFVVSIHDVAPPGIDAVRALVEAVTPRIGTAMSLAIVPQRTPTTSERTAIRQLIARCDESLLHGWSHRRPPSLDPFSWLVGRNDEFAALTISETIKRLSDGITVLHDEYGVDASGTIPPAWRVGCIGECLASAGLQFTVGLRSLLTISRNRIELATSSWDPGPIGCLWPMCEALGKRPLAKARATPVITLHPADLRRGLLPRALAMIDRHLYAGRRPATFGQLVTALHKADAPKTL